MRANFLKHFEDPILEKVVARTHTYTGQSCQDKCIEISMDFEKEWRTLSQTTGLIWSLPCWWDQGEGTHRWDFPLARLLHIWCRSCHCWDPFQLHWELATWYRYIGCGERGSGGREKGPTCKNTDQHVDDTKNYMGRDVWRLFTFSCFIYSDAILSHQQQRTHPWLVQQAWHGTPSDHRLSAYLWQFHMTHAFAPTRETEVREGSWVRSRAIHTHTHTQEETISSAPRITPQMILQYRSSDWSDSGSSTNSVSGLSMRTTETSSREGLQSSRLATTPRNMRKPTLRDGGGGERQWVEWVCDICHTNWDSLVPCLAGFSVCEHSYCTIANGVDNRVAFFFLLSNKNNRWGT